MINVTEHERALIEALLETYVPECEIRVFGSRLSGNHKEYSDLDLAIVGSAKLPSGVIARLKESFAESVIPFRVDILDWHAISKEFQSVILAGYEILQTKKSEAKEISREKNNK